MPKGARQRSWNATRACGRFKQDATGKSDDRSYGEILTFLFPDFILFVEGLLNQSIKMNNKHINIFYSFFTQARLNRNAVKHRRKRERETLRDTTENFIIFRFPQFPSFFLDGDEHELN